MFERILVATDGSVDSRRAALTAADLARALGASLTALAPYQLPSGFEGGPDYSRDLEAALRMDSARRYRPELLDHVLLYRWTPSPSRPATILPSDQTAAQATCPHHVHTMWCGGVSRPDGGRARRGRPSGFGKPHHGRSRADDPAQPQDHGGRHRADFESLRRTSSVKAEGTPSCWPGRAGPRSACLESSRPGPLRGTARWVPRTPRGQRGSWRLAGDPAKVRIRVSNWRSVSGPLFSTSIRRWRPWLSSSVRTCSAK